LCGCVERKRGREGRTGEKAETDRRADLIGGAIEGKKGQRMASVKDERERKKKEERREKK
jgi:hypothetical protein